MKIAVDVDDVLCQTGVGFISFHNEEFGTDLRPDQFYDRDCLKPFGETPAELSRRIIKYVDDNALNVKPMENSQKVLEKLEKTHELIVVTGRTNSVSDKTKTWIEKNYPNVFSDFVSTNAHFVNGGKNKGEFCQELNVDLLIEDYFGYARECTEVGIKALLFSQPWNRNIVNLAQLIERVDSWRQIEKAVERQNDR